MTTNNVNSILLTLFVIDFEFAKQINTGTILTRINAPIGFRYGGGTVEKQTYYIIADSASKNKELAWLFISYCIKERTMEELGDDYLIAGYPINRKNTLKLLEKAFGSGYEEDIAKIDTWNKERNSTDMVSINLNLLSEIQNICKEFYDGKITAEDCAAQVQNRSEIYLKE